ncbi:MAG: hypothetical protein B6U78_00015 [Candidatus Aenigmarchaeota archaeon ex4484_224]|nr:MAG: hypothetical protein B6U78_00015 [Candidatus Aenigmarchaeota archaeon ex4484_224]
MEKQLIKIYKDFIQFYKEDLWENSRKWIGAPNISKKEYLKSIFIHNQPTFIEFWGYVRILIYFGQDSFLKLISNDQWDILSYKKFLENQNLVKFEKNRVKKISSIIKQSLTIPLTKTQIEKILSKRLKISLKKFYLKNCLFPLFKKFPWLENKLTVKEEFDQMQISFSSMLTLLSKISFYFPFKEKFLVAGADDFLQVYLSIVYPEISIITADLDSDLLSITEEISSKLDLEIKTIQKDFTKSKLNRKIFGFYTNPPYTLPGAIKFLNFGLSGFSNLGGYSFLVLGDEAIKNRRIFLQQFFNKNNLLIEEIEKGISYPLEKSHDEVKSFLQEAKKINHKPKNYLFARIFILSYIPFKLPKFKYQDIFFYL